MDESGMSLHHHSLQNGMLGFAHFFEDFLFLDCELDSLETELDSYPNFCAL